MRVIMMIGWLRHFLIATTCVLTEGGRIATVIRYSCVDLLYGLGSFGCIMSAIYLPGHTLCYLHLRMYERQEKHHELFIMDHIKNASRQLFYFTRSERKEFSKILRWMSVQRILIIFTSTIQQTLLYAVGAVVTAMKLNSWLFMVVSIPVVINYIFVNYYAMSIFTPAHTLTAHSTNYFRIRFRRIHVRLHQLIRQQRLHDGMQSGQMSPNFQADLIKVMDEIEQVLHEVHQHNHTIKFFLRDIVSVMGPMIALVMVYMTDQMPFMLRIVTSFGCGFLTMLASISLFNASGLHLCVKETSRILHSCQVVLKLQGRDDQQLNIKLHLLKLIYRTSCPGLPIGFTVGDAGSFSPMTAGSFISDVISISLIFLNARHWIVRLCKTQTLGKSIHRHHQSPVLREFRYSLLLQMLKYMK